ncbi:MAG: hypothetical protein ACOY9Y_05450 [Bacillota bacterium]
MQNGTLENIFYQVFWGIPLMDKHALSCGVTQPDPLALKAFRGLCDTTTLFGKISVTRLYPLRRKGTPAFL